MVRRREGASSQVPKIRKGDIADVGERGDATTESWEWGERKRSAGQNG